MCGLSKAYIEDVCNTLQQLRNQRPKKFSVFVSGFAKIKILAFIHDSHLSKIGKRVKNIHKKHRSYEKFLENTIQRWKTPMVGRLRKNTRHRMERKFCFQSPDMHHWIQQRVLIGEDDSRGSRNPAEVRDIFK